jgi:predicted phosphodiesterase
MRTLIIADIHANLTALDAVLAHAQGAFDTVWCLGDVVGYGPKPNECVQRIRALDRLVCLSGNHDYAAIRKINLNTFNPVAATALRWTRSTLLPESRDYLDALPSIQLLNGITLAHGSPRHPVWEYISDTALAEKNFAHFTDAICLIGHTHIARVFHHDSNRCHEFIAPTGNTFSLNTGRYILNPGSVGQPRDRDPRAAYALLNLDTAIWEQRRVVYNIAETQRHMQAHGLPKALITRLDFGT